MKKLLNQVIFLLSVAGLFFLAGFFVCTTRVKNVPIGLALIVVGQVVALSALLPVGRLLRLQKQQKEERFKKLEQDIALIKSKLMD